MTSDAYKLKRILCAFFGHGKVYQFEKIGLRVILCERCNQIVGVSTNRIGLLDKVTFPDTYLCVPELEGTWQEWGQMGGDE